MLQFDRMEEIGAPLDQSTDLVAFIGRQLALPDCREKVAERCGAVLWRRERAGGEGNRRSAPDRNRAVDKQAQCRRVLVLCANLEDGFENVVEVLGKLAVEALAGGFWSGG